MVKLIDGPPDPHDASAAMPAASAAEKRKAEFEATWEQPKGLLGFFQVIDNIPIAVRYMVTSFGFFIVGGVLALEVRPRSGRIGRPARPTRLER